ARRRRRGGPGHAPEGFRDPHGARERRRPRARDRQRAREPPDRDLHERGLGHARREGPPRALRRREGGQRRGGRLGGERVAARGGGRAAYSSGVITRAAKLDRASLRVPSPTPPASLKGSVGRVITLAAA